MTTGRNRPTGENVGMAWTTPPVTRLDEPFTGDERATLDGVLGWQRATLLHKCAGLTAEQLALRAAEPSALSSG